jgi:hypothetical protein
MTTSETSAKLRTLSDEQLANKMSGWKEHTGNYILCEIEFKRRQARGNEIRGWFSLVISIFAFLVSIAAFFLKQCP